MHSIKGGSGGGGDEDGGGGDEDRLTPSNACSLPWNHNGHTVTSCDATHVLPSQTHDAKPFAVEMKDC